MLYSGICKQVDSLLFEYFQTIDQSKESICAPISNYALIKLQELYVMLSHDSDFCRELSLTPQLLNGLGIKKSIHINRLILRILVDPILRKCSETGDIDGFSIWDHYLFANHIQLIDSPSWFAESFWDINRHAFGLVDRSKVLNAASKTNFSKTANDGPVLFVFKGSPSLAHFHNLCDFLGSSSVRRFSSDVRVIFLDLMPDMAPEMPCKVFCLGGLSLSNRIRALKSIVVNTRTCCLVWVACVQNLGLYLFSRLAPKQAYWSMKYHSVTARSIDLSFRSSTYADTLNIDGCEWHGIPSDFSSIANHLYDRRSFTINTPCASLPKKGTDSHALRCLTLGREVKINSSDFASFAARFLVDDLFTYAYSGRNKSNWHAEVDKLCNGQARLAYLGWLQHDQMLSAIESSDIYIDSFPFGGGHTCFYAMSASLPVLMVNSEENRRCSFMMHLLDLRSYFGFQNDYQDFGIFDSSEALLRFLRSLVNDYNNHVRAQILLNISSLQGRLFNDWSNGDHYGRNCETILSKLKTLG